uniref:Chemokine interleukin-8-like domain-containing protein n=1 Tax=Periophthalmus magnuspinnatus TaxID=409849 RepID=A0A3B3ZPY6_9GOBI
MDPKVCVLLLLLFAALSGVPQDCCLSVAQKRLPAKQVQSYKVQEAGKGCDISATVVQVKGRMLCLPHPEGQQWVQKLMRIVDQRQQQ